MCDSWIHNNNYLVQNQDHQDLKKGKDKKNICNTRNKKIKRKKNETD